MPNREDFLATLREKGYRITPQRELIINAISPTSSHFTAEVIFDQVQEHTKAINIATIYRTLDLLVEEGLISRSDFGQGQTVYATGDHGPHLHLVCRLCGQVTAADAAYAQPLADSLRQVHQFKLDLNHITVFGTCANCRKGENDHAL